MDHCPASKDSEGQVTSMASDSRLAKQQGMMTKAWENNRYFARRPAAQISGVPAGGWVHYRARDTAAALLRHKLGFVCRRAMI
jgi:hypothetical protein